MSDTSEQELNTQNTALQALEFAVATDVGRRREENQDYYGIIEGEKYKFFIVADGMGGAKGGATASKLAISVVGEAISEFSDLHEDSLALAVQRANAQIYQKGASDESLAGMGTTFVGLAFVEDCMFICSVGDSRAYRIRNGGVKQLTTDHTLVMELLKSGAISIDQVDNHPVAHMLTRSLGPASEVVVDSFLCEDGPAQGDIYLLCSDGLYNLIDDEEFEQVIDQAASLDAATQQLIDLANERGGTDNITVILIRVGENYPRTLADFGIQVALTKAENQIEQELETAEPVATQLEITQDLSSKTKVAATTKLIKLENEVESSSVEATSAQNQISENVNGHALKQDQPKKDKPKADKVKTPDQTTASARERAQERIKLKEEQTKQAPQNNKSFDFRIILKLVSSPPVRYASFGVAMVLLGVYVGRTVFGTVEVQQVTMLDKPPLMHQSNVVVEEQITQLPAPAQEISQVPDQVPSQASEKLALTNETEISPEDWHPDKQEPSTLGNSIQHKKTSEIQKNISLRKANLVNLQAKIKALSEPLSNETVDRLRVAEVEVVKNKAEVEKADEELDLATRKLAIWYGRRQKLSEVDPVDLAAEVAVTSQEVRKIKDLFEKASWAYLKQVEQWRYNPNDADLTQNLKQLGAVRTQKRRDLAKAVRDAIDKFISESDKKIAEVSVVKEQLEIKQDQLLDEIKFVKILTGSNERAKFEKEQELIKEKEALEFELSELENQEH